MSVLVALCQCLSEQQLRTERSLLKALYKMPLLRTFYSTVVIWSFVNITGGIWILRSTVTNERMVTGNDGSLQALARHNPISEPPARAVASASPECAHGRMVEANALL